MERKQFHFGPGQLGIYRIGLLIFRSKATSVPRGTLRLENCWIAFTDNELNYFPTLLNS